MEEILNRDYILAIIAKANESQWVVQKVPIVRTHIELMDFLNERINDDSYSIFDMEEKFFSLLSLSPSIYGYDYIYPYSYNNSFIEGAHRPIRTSPEKFDAKLKELREKYKDDQEYENEKNYYQRRIKSTFIREAERLIWSIDYYRTLNELKTRRDVKMYSLDTIGWRNFTFNINDDLQVVVDTNFAYGLSSYFTVKINYKGFDIIPYSHIVNYYYANVSEIIRCTESFNPERNNWEYLIEKIVDVANTAVTSSDSLIKKYITDECEKTIRELNNLIKDPNTFCKDILHTIHDLHGLINVRNSFDYERKMYGIYPDEMSFTFLCEKVSGALLFMDNLNKQSSFIPELNKYIEELKLMNKDVALKIDRYIPSIEKQIKKDKLKKGKFEKIKNDIDKKIEPHNKKINILVASKIKEKKKKKEITIESIILQEIKNDYIVKHEDYKCLCDEEKRVSEEISKLSEGIRCRSNYKDMLHKCRELIEEKVFSKVA